MGTWQTADGIGTRAQSLIAQRGNYMKICHSAMKLLAKLKMGKWRNRPFKAKIF